MASLTKQMEVSINRNNKENKIDKYKMQKPKFNTGDKQKNIPKMMVSAYHISCKSDIQIKNTNLEQGDA